MPIKRLGTVVWGTSCPTPPLLFLTSDRIFNYNQVFRAMLDAMLWLSFCVRFGRINGTIRPIACANNGRS
ncbi:MULTISPECIES: hypothetical protein [unclassified Leptolyngbya]|uniref:hypothetical protein n=1 Tax=unclassified Leptolyngbya TaxID=2650499 RepID=UPI001681D03B|nr:MULTISPECIES: hypothetical protein [unclassified Leptolyngbya]MBD1914095.1 hypothetical protein [Leptolyngbya sp. FACHB-8]MBD2157308.1 hypothetical protein [Leptolyngbya sp. FACHB-16]